MTYTKKDLAINGGPRTKSSTNFPMFPGGLEIDEEEKKQVLEVLDNKYLFCYYGPKESPSKVKALEERYTKLIGTRHALALNSCTSALISALAQFGKLQRILGGMRRNRKLIKDGIRGVKGLEMREGTDEAGDMAICLVFYLPSAGQVEEFVQALQAEGVEAGGIYNKGVPEYKPDDCPGTLEWRGRSVHFDIPPQMSEADCAQVPEAIRKVASVLL